MPVVAARRRPLGIIVVAVLLVGRLIIEVTALATLDPGGILGWIADGSNVPEFEAGTAQWYLGTAGLLLIIATTAASLVGLWRFRTWGWSLSLIISGAILAIDLAWWYYGQPRYPGMFLNMVAVFYLNQRDVRAIFLPSSL